MIRSSLGEVVSDANVKEGWQWKPRLQSKLVINFSEVEGGGGVMVAD